MKRKSRKSIPLLLAVSLSAAVAGCGSMMAPQMSAPAAPAAVTVPSGNKLFLARKASAC